VSKLLVFSETLNDREAESKSFTRSSEVSSDDILIVIDGVETVLLDRE
jgi:hypothetical protein